MRIETRGNDHKVRMKPAFDLFQRLVEGLPVDSCGCSTAQRNVQGIARPLSRAYIVLCARAGIVRVLVGREKEDGIIRPEDVLSSIAVMNIPVDNQNSFKAVNCL